MNTPHLSFFVPHSAFPIPRSALYAPRSAFTVPRFPTSVPHSEFSSSSFLVPRSAFSVCLQAVSRKPPAVVLTPLPARLEFGMSEPRPALTGA